MRRLCSVWMSSIYILSLCFSISVFASEDLKAGEKEQKNKDIKLFYKQAIADYKHDRLYESEKVFRKILELDGKQKKAGYFLEYKIPRKLVEREAKKQECLRVEQMKVFSLKKKKMNQSKQEAARAAAEGLGKHENHARDARFLFVNGNDEMR